MIPKSTGMKKSRRNVLRILAGSGVLLLCGAGGCSTREKAVSVPQNIPQNNDPRYRWLTAAARAPSSHNMQPWMVGLPSGKHDILLYLRPQSMLPHSDPQNRQAIISLGGFLELLIMAAQSEGYQEEILLVPERTNKNSPVVHVKFRLTEAQPTPDGLLPFVSQRATCRGPFDPLRQLTETQLNILLVEGNTYGIHANGSNHSKMVSQISDLATRAWMKELEQQDIMREMLSVTRVGRKEIAHYRDGVAVQGFLPELAATLGMFPRDRIPAPDSTVMKSMREMGKQQAMTSVAWMWLVSTNNSLAQQIAAGRAFVRLHLRASQLGIALQPMSQLLEEFPSVASYRSDLYDNLDIPDGATVQMLVRLGFVPPGSSDSPSLRRPIDAV